jgi:hypothetical protein
MHMLAFGGTSESLFRGAFMQSGGPFSVGKQADGQVSNFFEIYSSHCQYLNSINIRNAMMRLSAIRGVHLPIIHCSA